MKRQRSSLESQAANSDCWIRELEDTLLSALAQLRNSRSERDALQGELENSRRLNEEILRRRAEENSSRRMQQCYPDQWSVAEIHATLDLIMQRCQKEKDDLQVEFENVRMIKDLLRQQAELVRKQAEEISIRRLPQPLTEFSFFEIQTATRCFAPAYKIAEGTRGSVYYKCVLRKTKVAVKVPGKNSFQDPSEFQNEVDDLSKLRHPNLVALIGVCPEFWGLIYEYLPNGSLEDHLNCKNDTHPQLWQTRMHIATELCSTLIFLHSTEPHGLVHGNLKPGNILLDANFGCKLSDFGAHRALSFLKNSGNVTESSNAYHYLDPDFRNTKRLSKSLDIYPFGIILLQLLSGRSAQGIAESAKNALLNGGNLDSFLDSSAGNWPHQVTQLAHLAVRCCDINPNRRPDLASEVLKLLETMRPSSAVPSTYQLAESDEDSDGSWRADSGDPPSYFICPILQVVMTDPHVAADGYSYEAKALQEWLAEHDTSPMTNVRLAHRNSIPNHPLRSAIQEWKQNH
ncbi:hypothetical protein DITRI_Ditri13aG0038600 [Diplodiscus trichospermus]